MTPSGKDQTRRTVVIGGGPAGLMAAECLASAGCDVILCEAKPTVGRKFLMAGKSGLNLTKDEPFEQFLQAFGPAAPWLAPMLREFDGDAVQNWAHGLGQDVFTGSSGRVFPVAMKASPLLRAWLRRLDQLGVDIRTRWRWQGWNSNALTFDTPQGPQNLRADVTILALGGASWSRLGSDGKWADILSAGNVDLTPFAPANAGIAVEWSPHMAAVIGQPLKGVELNAGPVQSRGEAMVSSSGLEGGGIYSISGAVRDGAPFSIDLMPDVKLQDLVTRLSRPRGKTSLSNHLRKTLRLGPVKTALLQEFGRPLPQNPTSLAQLIKALPVLHQGLHPLDEAISTNGGVAQLATTKSLMLSSKPSVFCAGEMLDWEAPTGGYLLTACLASGRWAASGGLEYLRNQ